LILASVVAALGFFIIPARRSQAKAEMRRKITDVRVRLSAALRKQFEEEIARSAARMQESVGPYSRFVRAEGEKLQETETRLRQLASDLQKVRERVDALAA
jgi:vacuolar-type H+-ATPase subunit D/Vma8